MNSNGLLADRWVHCKQPEKEVGMYLVYIPSTGGYTGNSQKKRWVNPV